MLTFVFFIWTRDVQL